MAGGFAILISAVAGAVIAVVASVGLTSSMTSTPTEPVNAQYVVYGNN